MIIRHRARLQFWDRAQATIMFTNMVIPEWARIIGWEVSGRGDMLTLEFESDSPAHFYGCPDNLAPPLLSVREDDTYTIDWHSLDGARYDEV